MDPEQPHEALAVFTVHGPAGERVRLLRQAGVYLVPLHLRRYDLEPGKVYLIGVQAFGQQVGVTAFQVQQWGGKMWRRWWVHFMLALVFAWTCWLGYRLYAGRIPLTNLPGVVVPPEEEGQILSSQVWPPKGPEARPFFVPLASPNGRYVMELRGWANRSVLLLREGSPGKRVIGFYMFKRLIVYKWAEDSSGVYLADYLPGGDTLLWDVGPVFPPAYRSAIKKVLIPCEAIHEAPWWQWQRWYWGMRCLFPDPFHPLAVWVPLVVTVLGVGAAIGYGYRLWRTPGVQSRVEKGLERLDRWWQNLKWRLFMRL